MRRYTVEFIGTFFLVLAIGFTAGLEPAGAFAPIAIGTVLLAMIYAGGHISGAHYNPAVTLSFWARGMASATDIVPYMAAQLFGAGSAALITVYLRGNAAMATGSFETGPLVVAEALFTFALCWVILNVATARGLAGNSFYGLAISSLVTGGIYAVGPISGAVFNPAVAVALALMGLIEWAPLWIYFLVQFSAAWIAALVFKAVVEE